MSRPPSIAWIAAAGWCFALLAAGPAAAQAPAAPAAPVAAAPADAEPELSAPPSGTSKPNIQALAQKAAPTAPEHASSPDNAIQLNTSQDSSNATLKISLPVHSDWTTLFSPNGEKSTAYTTSLSLTVTTPISKGDSSTELGTLDGFANATKFSLGFSQYFVPGRTFGMAMTPRGMELCQMANPKDPTTCSGAIIRKALGDQAAEEFLELGLKQMAIWSYGLSGTAAYNSHAYYDAGTLAKHSIDRTDPGATLYMQRISPDRSWAVTIEGQYQQTYQPAFPR